MFKKYFCNIKLSAGLCALFAIVISSYTLEYQMKNGHIKLVSGTDPAPPSFIHPFGIGDYGSDIFLQVLIFARTPIFYSFLIGFIRIVFSLVLGFLLVYLSKWTNCLDWMFETFQYIPTILLAILLLSPLQMIQANMPNQWIVYTVTVLILLGIPNLAQLIANEIRLFLQYEFVKCSKSLGGTPFHIYKLHIKPFLLSKLFIWFNQQMLQVLILMMHLSLFQVLPFSVGGTVFFISETSQQLNRLPWVAFGPVILYAFVILAMYMVTSGIKQVLKVDNKFIEGSILLNKIEERRWVYIQRFKQNVSFKK